MKQSPTADEIIESMRTLLYEQSVQSVKAGGWGRVAELRLGPHDFDALMRGVPVLDIDGNALDGRMASQYSIRLVVDKWLRQGECIPLDAQGNMVELTPKPAP